MTGANNCILTYTRTQKSIMNSHKTKKIWFWINEAMVPTEKVCKQMTSFVKRRNLTWENKQNLYLITHIALNAAHVIISSTAFLSGGNGRLLHAEVVAACLWQTPQESLALLWSTASRRPDLKPACGQTDRQTGTMMERIWWPPALSSWSIKSLECVIVQQLKSVRHRTACDKERHAWNAFTRWRVPHVLQTAFPWPNWVNKMQIPFHLHGMQRMK
jgi:hypothetical protein